MQWLVSVLTVVAVAWSAQAAEVTEQNDSTLNGEPSTEIAAFLAGESVAAWMSASCTGDIVAAQVYWKSQFGGAPATLEQEISILSPGAHPVPGAVMANQGGANAVVVGPSLADGAMNEFRFLDPPVDSVPLSVPILAGQQFVVALEFFNQSSGGAPFAPAPTTDQDGCQPLTNAADVIPGGWIDACPLGVAGDWVIRAVIDCQAAPVPVASSRSSALLVMSLALLGLLGAGRLAKLREARG